jgi:hypothetical protein
MASTLTVDNIVGATDSSAVHIPGSIIQVEDFQRVGSNSITSTSFVTTGITKIITPKFATSKILAIVNLGSIYNSTTSGQPRFTLYRGSTNLGGTAGTTSDNFGQTFNSAGAVSIQCAFTHLDSPSTTSAITYTVYVRTNTGTAVIGHDSARNGITLLEIAQ